jgi:hypothetical protein
MARSWARRSHLDAPAATRSNRRSPTRPVTRSTGSITYVSDANLFNNGSNIFGQLVAYTGAALRGGLVAGDSVSRTRTMAAESKGRLTSSTIRSRRFLVVCEFFSEVSDDPALRHQRHADE